MEYPNFFLWASGAVALSYCIGMSPAEASSRLVDFAPQKFTQADPIRQSSEAINIAVESDIPPPRAGSIQPSEVSKPEATSSEGVLSDSAETVPPRAGTTLPLAEQANSNDLSEEVEVVNVPEATVPPRSGTTLPPSEQASTNDDSLNDLRITALPRAGSYGDSQTTPEGISDITTTNPKPSAQRPVEVVNSVPTRRQSTAYMPTVAVGSTSNSQSISQIASLETFADSESYLASDKTVFKVELEGVSFLCDSEENTPATLVKLKNEDERLLILWDSVFFEDAGYDSETRCKQVSARLADFIEEGDFLYLTSGKLNGQPTLCLTSSEDGDCGEGITLHKGLLFTLKPEDNSQEKLESLVSLLESEQSDEEPLPLNE
ncbi:hypothetical protein IQ273_08325 [Nodosilinea sp. LEGE 07298]|uniref:COP23 domain-containing protein n=1 Tax=Nodosilinea sp. LEGE 07298 TaxID=2777970 RepID=UPI0019F5E182|nr:COP23 domain-containing protein [Nodosilinea sp. LEGE 07298]MBE9109420.1 hypothetical protein [Nodosilinea sp. LEGE 07298]